MSLRVKLIAICSTGLLLVGCGGEGNDNTPSVAPPETTTTTLEAERPIDVKKMLIGNGWSDDRIIPGAVNASYQVYPFVKPYDLVTRKLSPKTCYFGFMRADYQSGRAATDFSFTTHYKKAAVHMYSHTSSNERSFHSTRELPVDEITRSKLAEAFQADLQLCGNASLN